MCRRTETFLHRSSLFTGVLGPLCTGVPFLQAYSDLFAQEFPLFKSAFSWAAPAGKSRGVLHCIFRKYFIHLAMIVSFAVHPFSSLTRMGCIYDEGTVIQPAVPVPHHYRSIIEFTGYQECSARGPGIITVVYGNAENINRHARSAHHLCSTVQKNDPDQTKTSLNVLHDVPFLIQSSKKLAGIKMKTSLIDLYDVAFQRRGVT